MLTGRGVCDWCRADCYRATRETSDKQSAAYGILRCPRCGQPDRTCNEIAGRSFRMTWDRRSDWTWCQEGESYPRMPATRNELALRRMLASERFDYLMAHQAEVLGAIAKATGMPKAVLFGTGPAGFAMAPEDL